MNLNGDRSSGLPVFAAGLDAAAATLQGGDEFWPDVERLTGGDLTGHLDDALAGAAAPRVWLFVHEPGQPQLGVVAALSFARALGGRDQAAIVLDGDDRTTVLSRWSGREDAEGWIDMVRYGTSVLTSGVALPFAGRTAYLLGVGSYAPTDITSGEAEELLGRLRRQADDLLIVCPAPTAALWGGHADITLLCVDRESRDAARIAELGEELTARGAAPDGIVGYGEPAEVIPVEAEETAEDEGDVAPDGSRDEADLAPVDDLFADEDGDEQEEEKEEEVAPDAAPADETAAGSVAAALEEAALPDPADSFEVEEPTRRSTSGVFWLAAVVSVVLIAVVGFYYFKVMRPGDDFDARPPVTVAARQEATPGADEAADVAEEPVATMDSATTAAVPPGSAATDSLPAADVADGRPAETEPEVVNDATVPPETTDTPEMTPAGDGTGTEAPPVDPFSLPVGRDGWALWVYSFPDSAGATRELEILERREITAAVRIVEIADKGRWHRIYMGSFVDRAAARAATPALLARLRTDWAQPVRFYASNND